MEYIPIIALLILFFVRDTKSVNDERKRFYDGSGYPLQHGELTFLSSNGLYIKTIRLNKDGALDNELDLFNAPPEAEFLLVKDSKGIVLMQYALSA